MTILFPSDHQVRRRKKKSGLRRCDFTEGWVEFRDKRVAKRVAASLHNSPMGTRKRQKYYSDLWSIKVQQQGASGFTPQIRFMRIYETIIETQPR